MVTSILWPRSESLSMLEVEGEVLGYNKRGVWIRIPTPDGRAHRVLTMPRDFLPHGMATAERVVVEYVSDSLHHDGHAYVVEGRITRKVA